MSNASACTTTVSAHSSWLLAAVSVLLLGAPGNSHGTTSIPGGLAELDLGDATQARPAVYFGSRKVMTRKTARRWQAWIGIGLNMAPGDYVARIEYEDEQSEHRTITIAPRRHLATVDTAPNWSLTRTLFAAAEKLPLDVWRDELDTTLPLTYPVAGHFVNHFGSRVLDSRHGSYWRYELDFEAPGGAALVAPGAGIAHRMPIRANGAESVCIDHGMSLVSCLGPILEVQVVSGERVERAYPLGQSVTDPEGGPTVVSWLVRLNGVQVDPERFLPHYNQP